MRTVINGLLLVVMACCVAGIVSLLIHAQNRFMIAIPKDVQVTCKHDQLFVGTSEQVLFGVCGYPKRANRNSRHIDDQMAYHGDEDLYVYTTDGKVTSWQYTETFK